MSLSIEQERVNKLEADRLLKIEQAKAIRETYTSQISTKQAEIGVLEKTMDDEIKALEAEVIEK